MSDKPVPLIGVNASLQKNGNGWYKVPLNYVHAIYEAGAIPLLFPCCPDPLMLNRYLDRVDGMLFTGGDDYPAELSKVEAHPKAEYMEERRAETDLLLMKMLLEERNIPLLGICAGHQLLALASGGKLIQHLNNAELHGFGREVEHEVGITGGKWLKSIFNTKHFIVNSYHHQAVREDAFPPGLVISAMSPDGVIEAMERPGERFVLSVQWHPERIADKWHKMMLFHYFIQKCLESKRAEKG
ncbi:MAG: gamma-glutamyl-gamma-aminobutyrate hydrolase family protein [Candidatus Marinimicrobia bacterium]|jgi:putative glutamine amidotransferase|nr:gamma-glutamyl-gamma-aminobutyrate hydrolase family protein [Candidatus Neomarinimicrobiota bacterium]MDD4962124.1 gamma-glutamyl-gamma-aminobutyrate hydrolase family protein [Candidatus Neomarinimicrobiota bacterium]MDD5709125.1 gamma-glutamyl-gamma-aminobutyrate hydrolase family protein [Candidatus Neomarinimicrobiota bacterium]MDX9778288.1 gamma-glutamyl-gamma-aminobutyrate hydrolase family protein [bacterium]